MTTAIVAIFVWISSAILTAWVFRNNGRPAWIGAILGLIFGLAALIVSVIVFSLTGRRRGPTTA